MIAHNTKPTCLYHPTTVLFLDDNKAFLNALELELSAQNKMLTFTDPNLAMQAIQSCNEDINQAFFRTVDQGDANSATDYTVSLELNGMFNLIYDKSRFDNIGVIVVDYDMPDINGYEFCRRISDKNIFKIMLTAEADKDTAINAFNNGAIDKFLLKTSENLYQELTDAITELKNRYFRESSRTIMEGIGKSLKISI